MEVEEFYLFVEENGDPNLGFHFDDDCRECSSYQLVLQVVLRVLQLFHFHFQLVLQVVLTDPSRGMVRIC